MNRKLGVSALLLVCLVLNFSVQGQGNDVLLTGPYLGQEQPGLKPKVFAPGVISTSGWEISGIFSPDMQEFYYIREIVKDKKLEQQFLVYKNQGGQWQPQLISLRVGQPFISPDGKTMHLGGRFKERSNSGWSEIQNKSDDFTQYRIMSLSTSAKDTYVFDEATNDGNGVLRYSKLVNGQRQTPKPLAKEINTGKWNAHPFIAPDESYIIWDGQRQTEVRNADLFISFRKRDGSWGEAIKFGEEINTPASEGGARVTPDGKYLFFNRTVGSYDWTHENGEVENIPNVDIFWVDAQVIENLRPKL